MIGGGATFVRVVPLRAAFLVPVDALEAGVGVDPLLALDGDPRFAGPQRTRPDPFAHFVSQVLQLAEVALAEFFEQASHRTLIGNAQPAGNTLQHPVGPQHEALADAARAAHQANEHHKDGVEELIVRIVSALVAHMAPAQSAQSQGAKEFDHRNQTRLAGQVPPSGFIPDIRGRIYVPSALSLW